MARTIEYYVAILVIFFFHSLLIFDNLVDFYTKSMFRQSKYELKNKVDG